LATYLNLVLREAQRELALKQVDELMTGEEKEIRAKEQYKKAQEAAAKVGLSSDR